VAAVGMASVGKLREAAVVLALIGTIWAVVANRKDLSQRDYTLSEAMGHLQLDALDPQAALFLNADDTSATSLYLQRVKGVRPDVVIVQSPFLGPGSDGLLGWYDRALLRLHPELRPPDYAGIADRAAGSDRVEWAVAAWANANASWSRPLFFERPPGPEILRSGWTLVPAGHLLRMVPREEQRIDQKYWTSPVEPESLPSQFRRERGQYVEYRPGEVRVRPEAYERRLLRELLRARKNLADWRALSGTPEGLQRSAELYESILELDPWMKQDAGAVVPLARAYYALKRYDRAEPLLKSAVELPLPPRIRGHLFVLLADICGQGRRTDEAARWKAAALAVPELPDDLRRQLEGR
jgi:tetratricopeptide (TPR) repeat protein